MKYFKKSKIKYYKIYFKYSKKYKYELNLKLSKTKIKNFIKKSILLLLFKNQY